MVALTKMRESRLRGRVAMRDCGELFSVGVTEEAERVGEVGPKDVAMGERA